jgi:hypothetical protein
LTLAAWTMISTQVSTSKAPALTMRS